MKGNKQNIMTAGCNGFICECVEGIWIILKMCLIQFKRF